MPAGNGTPSTERLTMVDRRTFVGLGLAVGAGALARAAGANAEADPPDTDGTAPQATTPPENATVEPAVPAPNYGDSDHNQEQQRHYAFLSNKRISTTVQRADPR